MRLLVSYLFLATVPFCDRSYAIDQSLCSEALASVVVPLDLPDLISKNLDEAYKSRQNLNRFAYLDKSIKFFFNLPQADPRRIFRQKIGYKFRNDPSDDSNASLTLYEMPSDWRIVFNSYNHLIDEALASGRGDKKYTLRPALVFKNFKDEYYFYRPGYDPLPPDGFQLSILMGGGAIRDGFNRSRFQYELTWGGVPQIYQYILCLVFPDRHFMGMDAQFSYFFEDFEGRLEILSELSKLALDEEYLNERWSYLGVSKAEAVFNDSGEVEAINNFQARTKLNLRLALNLEIAQMEWAVKKAFELDLSVEDVFRDILENEFFSETNTAKWIRSFTNIAEGDIYQQIFDVNGKE